MTVAPTAEADISAAAIASFDGCGSDRLRTLLQALTEHLHAFAREVRLTEAELEDAVRVLTETGHITDDRRQEFVLWSDALGLSMLIDAIAHLTAAGNTESTVRGPFWVPNSPLREYGERIIEQPGGTPAWVHGRVLGTDGRPIVMGALLARSILGHYMYAAGGNAGAARLEGVSVRKVQLLTFVLLGGAAALGGIVDDSRVLSAQASSSYGESLTFTVIAGVVIGGTSILGGEGSVWKAIVGVLFIALIGNGYALLNLDPLYQQITLGGLMLAAVGLDAFARRREG